GIASSLSLLAMTTARVPAIVAGPLSRRLADPAEILRHIDELARHHADGHGVLLGADFADHRHAGQFEAWSGMHEGARLAQAIALSSVSFPQNISPSDVMNVGEPKMSSRCASAVCSRSLSLMSVVCAAARICSASTFSSDRMARIVSG